MIPVKLELYNFLAYREPEPLDLTGIHLACLAGANGAGKSSLLDAITWSLWGKARTRRDDDLIHGDEIEMWVKLTFVLEGNRYRVTRYRSRQGRGNSLLYLEVEDGGEWRSLTDSSIRATQDHIDRLLRLDYQTFINSAFLMQGRADEFTKKTPGERKTILGEILGLNVWVEYEERAKRRLRAVEQEREQIDGDLQRIEADLAREADYQRELIAAQRALTELSGQVKEAEQGVHALEDAHRERDSRQVRHDDLARRVRQAEDDITRSQADRQQYVQRLDGYQQVLAAREEIEAGYAALQIARGEEHDLSTRLIEQSDLRSRLGELQQTVGAERSRLEAEHGSLIKRGAELERTILAGDEEHHALEDAQVKIERLEAREVERDAWRERLTALREERAELETGNKTLLVDMDRIKGQQDEIAAATEPICPLCQQELSDSHRADLLERLAAEGAQKGELYRDNRERIEQVAAEIKTLTRDLSDAEAELRNLPPLREYVARLTERFSHVEAAQQEMAEADARMAEVERLLAERDYAHDAQAQLAGIQAQLAGLGYDEAAHHDARNRLAEYEAYEARKGELDRALETAPELETMLSRLGDRIDGLEGEITEDRTMLDALAAEIAELDEQLVDLRRWEPALADLRDRERQANYAVGAAQQKLNALDQQRHRREELHAKRDQLGSETSIYEELKTAFGKDGIPAMIIEAAIPEIEEEANHVLSRMTDGRMHVRFETQREKVTGGIKETLDIRIADELGTRDYETFSGGEAFRVDFAIRLALSRLLARRAGAQLRTLIIDEGFGSQDAQGRERLVQAITTIKDDFDLILVITHIDDLKEAFPVRIEVTKTSQGSVMEII